MFIHFGRKYILYVLYFQPQLDNIAFVMEKASLAMITYTRNESFRTENGIIM